MAMAPKRYQIVLLFALLLQWAAAPWLPACCAAPAGHRPAPQDVFPLAHRYRQELRTRMALASLLPAVGGARAARTPRTWPPVPARPFLPMPTRPNLLYLLKSLRW
jgi:hypothetical protein